MKKILSFLLVLTFMFMSLGLKTVYAASGSNNSKESTYTSSEEIKNNIFGMNHTKSKGIAVTNGAKHRQSLNIFDMKTDGFSSKLVTWAMQTNNAEYARVNIIAAAKDYERRHPGWIVLGGINADQYYFKNGNDLAVDGSAVYQPQPYFPMVSDGENRFTVSPYGNATNIVGFKNDGSKDSFVTETGGAGIYTLTIYNEDGSVNIYEVSGINNHSSGDSVSVWSPLFSEVTYGSCVPKNVTSESDLYIVEDAELAYLNNSREYKYQKNTVNGIDSFFGRGVITKVDKSTTLNKGQFAIETANKEVQNALAVGKKIVVQQEFASEEMNKCEEGIGYHAVHRVNGVDGVTDNGYDTNQYSRALFGKKADGTYVLITADYVFAKETDGLNYKECNAVADAYGVTDMYQMDGGGSVTAMARTESGGFEVTNVPRDSGNPKTPRANFSYLFFVARDPGVRIDEDATTYHSITLNKIPTVGNAKIENIKVKVGEDIYDFNEDTLVIDNLAHDSSHTLYVQYDIVQDGKRLSKVYPIVARTERFRFPVAPLKVGLVTKDTIEIVKKDTKDSENIKNVKLTLNDKTYDMNDAKSFTIEELEGSSSYIISYTYDFVDPATGNIYTQTEEVPLKVDTKSFVMPSIIEFEVKKQADTYVRFKYKYTDYDNVSTDAYILCDGVMHKVTSKSGDIKIDDLNLASHKYKFIFIVVYEDQDTDKVLQVESEVIELGTEAPVDPVVPDEPAKKGCSCKKNEGIIALFGSLTLCAYLLLKKNN